MRAPKLRSACAAFGIAAALSVGGALAGSAPRGVVIQPLGAFHAGEASARHGERWWVLWRGADARANNRAARLASARVRVARVHDPIADAAGDATGEDVSVPAPANGREIPLMLLRGPGLNAGPVAMAEVEDRSADGLPAYALRLGGREFHLRTSCRPNAADKGRESRSVEVLRADTERADCAIEWIDGERRQVLIEMQGTRTTGDGAAQWMLGDDATPHLVFAGDLDRDGRPDLILETSDHYNLSRPTLFLSSGAAAGEGLRRESEYRAVGC
jgi:hypothetical protein